MANFNIFKPILYNHEGGYADAEGDSGGETWMGIARNKHPKWAGWQFIDANRKFLPTTGPLRDRWKKFSQHLWKNVPQLQPLVDQFYIVTFWNQMQGDKLNNQSIANFIGDWGINAGLQVPIKNAQEVLGFSIKDQDGVLGPKTLAGINGANGLDFFNKLKQERIKFYHAVVNNKPETKKFLKNWLDRTNSFTYKA